MLEGRTILKVLGFSVCMLIAGSVCFAQKGSSRIVNDYIQVYEIISCDSSVRVTNSQQYHPDDRVLLIQMKGARIYTKNDSLFGKIYDLATSGYAEFLTIKSVRGDLIEFTTRLTNDYDVGGAIQLVHVAVYDSLVVKDRIEALQWNGTVGGVVVIEVKGNLYLNNDINVSGAGFRGGVASFDNDGCNTTDYIVDDWFSGKSGEKGEGIASLGVNYPVSGRGPLGNGGGGGNGTNSGGGGGSNGGAGGVGGFAVRYCNTFRNVGGLPGAELASFVPQQRLFMGGGGGGGHQNNDQGVDQKRGTAGNHGGGIVIIRAGTIYGNGSAILANGLSVQDTTEWDGAGAGGAGGTILIECDKVVSPLFLSAIGGNGGYVKNPYSSHGPGGGGGGGVVVLSKLFSNITVNVDGGTSGLELDPDNSDNNYLKPNGAADGGIGRVFTDGIQWRKPYSVALTVQGDAVLCPGQQAVLQASEGFTSYKWNTGDTSRIITVTSGGKYSVTTVDQGGCVYKSRDISVVYDPISFSVQPKLDFGIIDYRRESIRTFTVNNTDDEPITVDSIVGLSAFTIVNPVAFPVIIPAGQNLIVEISITPQLDTTYSEVARVWLSNPCVGSAEVSITAGVNEMSVRFEVPDTTAAVGTVRFAIPIRAYVTTPNKRLDSTITRITVTFDTRSFAPSGIQSGIIVGDVIDRIYNVRTVTIETDPMSITNGGITAVWLEGTILNGAINRTPISIAKVDYVYVFQTPTTVLDTGSIETDFPCYRIGRQITFYRASSIEAYPNPAQDLINTHVNLSAPGEYKISFYDLLGQLVYSQSKIHDGIADAVWDLSVDVSSWGAGSYLMIFTSPLSSDTRQIDIAR